MKNGLKRADPVMGRPILRLWQWHKWKEMTLKLGNNRNEKK